MNNDQAGKNTSKLIARTVALCVVPFGVGVGLFLSGCLQVDVVRDGIRPAPRVGIVMDSGMRVVTVEKGSPAEAAGVKKGDILKGVNKINLAESSGAFAAIRRVDISKKITLRFLRGEQNIILELEASPLVGSQGAPTWTPVPADMTYF